MQWKHQEYWINTCLPHFRFAVFTLSGNETVFTHPISCDVVNVRQPTMHTLYLVQISDCNWWRMRVYISRVFSARCITVHCCENSSFMWYKPSSLPSKLELNRVSVSWVPLYMFILYLLQLSTYHSIQWTILGIYSC